MNSKQFLLLGGIVLLILGVGGLTVLGPTPDQSALGEFNWLDSTENLAHLILGAVALGAYYLLKDIKLQRYLVILIGIIALVVAVLGFMAGNTVPNVGVTNLEVSDNILHLMVGLGAFYAAFIGDKSRT